MNKRLLRRLIRVLIPALAVLVLAGCRIRVVTDPKLADQNLTRLNVETPATTPTDAPETTEPEPPEPLESTEAETTEPPESTEAETTEPPESTEPTAPPAPPAPPAATASPEPTAVPETDTPPATTAPPEPSAPAQTEPPVPEESESSTQIPGESSRPGPAADENGNGDGAGEELSDDPDAPPLPEIIDEEETNAAEALEETGTIDLSVTFDPNGGESGIIVTTVERGAPYGVLPAAEWRGRIFDGWWTDPTAGDPITSDTIVTAETDHVLYAHWTEPRGFVLHFDGNGGRVKSREAALQLLPGEPIGEMPVPLREGYDFLGWWTDPTGGTELTAETVFETETDRTAYAHWAYNPLAFWTFTLQNKTQQIYLCQQAPVYFESADHLTQIFCPLITDTGSYNVAAYLDAPETTDDWVLAKNPSVIVRSVGSMAEAEPIRAAVQQRFPDRPVLIVQNDALGGGPAGIYARIALAKYLYGDWYTDVDLSVVAAELGLAIPPFS